MNKALAFETGRAIFAAGPGSGPFLTGGDMKDQKELLGK
jgi:hypothetical protein